MPAISKLGKIDPRFEPHRTSTRPAAHDRLVGHRFVESGRIEGRNHLEHQFSIEAYARVSARREVVKQLNRVSAASFQLIGNSHPIAIQMDSPPVSNSRLEPVIAVVSGFGKRPVIGAYIKGLRTPGDAEGG